MMDIFTSDTAIALFTTLGLAVTGVNILRDARAQRAKFVPTRPVLVQDLPSSMAETRKIAA